MKYYIAYGSNLNIKQMANRCPTAQIVGTGSIKDYRLKFNLHLTIEPAAGESVPVAIYQVTPTDERRLDAYEGYPNYYRKEEMNIEVNSYFEGKKKIKAFVYIMNEPERVALPYDSYIDICLEGYRNFEFDVKNIKEAYQRTLNEVKGKK